MKVCDQCQKRIEGLDFIQVTFIGKVQQISLIFKRAVQFEFCSLNCFQEFFNIFAKEKFEEEERSRKQMSLEGHLK